MKAYSKNIWAELVHLSNFQCSTREVLELNDASLCSYLTYSMCGEQSEAKTGLYSKTGIRVLFETDTNGTIAQAPLAPPPELC